MQDCRWNKVGRWVWPAFYQACLIAYFDDIAHMKPKMTRLPVMEVKTEGMVDGGKGKPIPGDLGLVKEIDLQAFLSRAVIEIPQAGSEHHVNLVHMGQIEDRK